jgi:hypothetical protein
MTPQGVILRTPSIAATDSNATMVTPGRVAIAMMATLTPLIPISVTNTVPIAVTILSAIAAPELHADSTFAHADADLRGRRQSHRQHCGSYHA